MNLHINIFQHMCECALCVLGKGRPLVLSLITLSACLIVSGASHYLAGPTSAPRGPTGETEKIYKVISIKNTSKF